MNDKELIINGKPVRSPEQQVYENMKEIEELKKIIKKYYKTSSALTSSSASDSTANTNVGTAKEGWLMTEDGLLFRIDGNDGTTLLLTYYADLKGPQGDTGPAGTTAINDNATALDSTWSSQKIDGNFNTTIGFVATMNSIFYTKTTPTLNGDYYEINRSDLLNYQSIDQRNYLGKQVILLDNDDNVKQIYSIYSFSEVSPYTIQLIFRGDIGGGGSQLYQHNINITAHDGIDVSLQIVNDNSSEMSFADVCKWINENGFNYTSPKYRSYLANGKAYSSGTFYIIKYCYTQYNTSLTFYCTSTSNNDVGFGVNSTNFFVDTVIPL